MASPHSIYTTSLLFLLSLQLFSSISEAIVPASGRFTYVNQGYYGEYRVEYNANYRFLTTFRMPFQLCFYNTTPNSYTLALRMGSIGDDYRARWVWEANRGKPVHENATLTFGRNGNLVLAEADGRVVWQTNTASKGVVGFEVLPNGNMVLRDGNGNFVWQSFDSPTDTLLMGSSLRVGVVDKLVSRASIENNIDGPYSLVLEPERLGMYYKSTNLPRPVLYSAPFITNSLGDFISLTIARSTDDGFLYQMGFDFLSSGDFPDSFRYMVYTRYNNSYSFLRLGIDGNLRFYTYNPNVQYVRRLEWEVTYTFLERDSIESECQLPERCGNFGLCDNNQCVACPTPNGIKGWSEDCNATSVTSCKADDFRYYKLEGVDHFMSKYTMGDGPMKQSACKSKCTNDCKCMGYFYHTDQSRCWIAYDLKTMSRVDNSAHLAYIKAPKK